MEWTSLLLLPCHVIVPSLSDVNIHIGQFDEFTFDSATADVVGAVVSNNSPGPCVSTSCI